MNTVPSMQMEGGASQGLQRAVSSRKLPKQGWRQRQQQRIAAEAAAIWKVLKPYPSTAVWPLVVLAALVLAGVWSLTWVAQESSKSTKERVSAMATDVATWYRQAVVEAYAPALSLSVVIRHDPTFSRVYTLFNNSAPELVALSHTVALRALQLAPNGVIQMIYPEQENNLALGYDLFENPYLPGTLDTIRNGGLTLMGPLNFIQGGFGVRARLPVFIRDVDENTTWGSPRTLSDKCGSLCYNASDRSKFWGFSIVLIGLLNLHNSSQSRLVSMATSGYNYELLAPNWIEERASSDPSNMTTLAHSDDKPQDPVQVDVILPGTRWILRVAPHGGWSPIWYPPLLVGIIILSVAMSVLMFAVLVSRRQHQALLEALLPREMIDHLKNYNAEWRLGPRVTDIAGATTADVLLNLLGELLEGVTPDLRDIVLIRQQILQNMDIYQPLNFSSQLRDANLDDDVTKALIHQLGGKFSFTISPSTSDDDCDEGFGEVRTGAALHKSLTMSQHDYATLSGALAMILAPQGGWYDNGPDMSDAASDAALPTHDTEVAISTHPSNPIFGRAASLLLRQPSWRCGSPEQAQTTASLLGPQASCNAHGSTGGGGGGSGGSGTLPTSTTAVAVSEGGLAPAAIVMTSQSKIVPADPVQELPTVATASGMGNSHGCASDDGDTEGTRGGDDCGDGAAAAAPSHAAGGTSLRRPPKKSDSYSNHLGLGRRRKSMLLSVSIANGSEGGGGGAGGGGGQSKAQTGSSHPDAVMTFNGAGHTEAGNGNGNGMMMGRLWASTVSRRSITGIAAAAAFGAMMSKKPPTPPAPVLEEVERLLAQADSWQFDTWRLRDATNGHPLSALGFYLIHRAGLISQLKLKPAVLARLLRHIEAGYNDNPYHNATHAADVLQTLHVILHGGQLHAYYVDHLGLLAAYFAAIVHDYGHPGLTNDFLIATSDPLAVRYNDRSPLENHHAAAAFSSMRRPGLDMLAPLSTEQKSSFRKQVIDMVLATDMKQHFSLLSHFSTVHRLASYNKPVAATPVGGAPPPTGCIVADGQASVELQAVSIAAPSVRDMAPKPLDETERLLSLQMLIKAADLGHLGEGLAVHKRWLRSLEEEFFRQGDRERQLSLPISPLFDRAKQGVSKSQVGFYEFVALPLVHALASAFPGSQPLMTCFMGNYNHYITDTIPILTESRSFKLPASLSSMPQQPQQLGRQQTAAEPPAGN